MVDVPGHADYYDVVSILVLVFSAIIAPELLCADRRSQVLQLYLVRPLTPTDYVAGRWLAFFTIVSGAGLLGPDRDVRRVHLCSAGAPRLHPGELARRAALPGRRRGRRRLRNTTIPLAVSGFTARRAYAAGFVIGLFIISTSAANALTTCTEREVRIENGATVVDRCEAVTGQWAKWIGLADFGALPSHLGDMIFGEDPDSSDAMMRVTELNDAIPIAWYILLTAGPAAVLLRRYQKAAL